MIPAIGCELCCFYLNQQSILINIDNTSILEIDKQFLKTFYFMHQIGSMNSERATAVFAKLSSSWPVKPSSVELRLALILVITPTHPHPTPTPGESRFEPLLD